MILKQNIWLNKEIWKIRNYKLEMKVFRFYKFKNAKNEKMEWLKKGIKSRK